MEVRNGKPWANPEGYGIKFHTCNPANEWRCEIDQVNYNGRLQQISFYQYVHGWDRLFKNDDEQVALFRVRRKIQHGYKVHNSTLAAWYPQATSCVIQQDRPRHEKTIVNYAYPADYYANCPDINDTFTIAIFRVKRKDTNEIKQQQ